MTSRSKIKQPTSLNRQRPPSSSAANSVNTQPKFSRQKFESETKHDYKPRINKNTERMLQNRNKRMEDGRKVSRCRAASNPGAPKEEIIKATDKYLL